MREMGIRCSTKPYSHTMGKREFRSILRDLFNEEFDIEWNNDNIVELIDYYMKREKLSKEKAIKRVQDNRFIANLLIFDEIDVWQYDIKEIINERTRNFIRTYELCF